MQRRHAAHHLIDTYRISARRACRVLRLQRASFAYQAHRRAHPRLRELAQVRVCYGSQRLYMGQPYPCAGTSTYLLAPVAGRIGPARQKLGEHLPAHITLAVIETGP